MEVQARGDHPAAEAGEPSCEETNATTWLLGGSRNHARKRPKEMAMAVVTQPKPTGAAEPSLASAASEAGIELYWLPLGAGGWFVKLNGRIWEAAHARLEHRRPLDLYHTALVVRVPEGRFVVENCWPIPDADGPSRGVRVQGPVGSRRMGRWGVFRYEVRCWRNGVIARRRRGGRQPQP